MGTKEKAESMLGRIVTVLARVLKEKGPEILLAIGGIIIDVINKLSREDGKMFMAEIAKCLRREPCWVKPKWRREGNVFYLTLPPTTGRTASDWINYFGDGISGKAQKLLLDQDFPPTTGVSYEVAILSGLTIDGEDNAKIEDTLRSTAKQIQISGGSIAEPHPEIAPLLMDYLSTEEIEDMGLWLIVVMHDTPTAQDGYREFLGVHRLKQRIVGRGIGTYCCAGKHVPGADWPLDFGAAFVISRQ